MARDVREICERYGLDDALVFTEWRHFTRNLFGPYLNRPEDLFDPEWDMILRALRARICSAG